MSHQRVPSWDLDDNPRLTNPTSLDYEVAELTWENGQLAMHGLRPPRVPDKRAIGTLESLVDQATKSGGTRALDALVPCHRNRNRGRPAAAGESCGCKSKSASESTAGGGEGIREKELGAGGYTSTSVWSPENSADSVSHSHSRSQSDEQGPKKKSSAKSSVSTKRSRAAAIHNQSERKRRDKINQRMKTLQKLVPNSSKTDKASILDEVIEYLKQLQAQVNMMSRMNMSQMMMPLALQQLQMSMMAMPGIGVMAPPMIPQTTPLMPPQLAPMPMPPWDIPPDRIQSMPPDLLSTFLACQSQQPMSVDGYARLAALYQQFQQNPASASKN